MMSTCLRIGVGVLVGGGVCLHMEGVGRGGSRGFVDKVLASVADAEKAVARHREGPTIFLRLWQLRAMSAEERKDRLESHRMRRYVMAVEAAIEAGPVQTSLAGVYDGTDDDDVGLDMEEEDDVTSMGSVASWVNWNRWFFCSFSSARDDVSIISF